MQLDPNQIFRLELSGRSLEVIFQALQEAPYKLAAPLINELLPQLAAQGDPNGVPKT